jgi:hypothetical protein
MLLERFGNCGRREREELISSKATNRHLTISLGWLRRLVLCDSKRAETCRRDVLDKDVWGYLLSQSNRKDDIGKRLVTLQDDGVCSSHGYHPFSNLVFDLSSNLSGYIAFL